MKKEKPSMEKVKKLIKKVHHDPKLMESVRQFIRYHGGEPVN